MIVVYTTIFGESDSLKQAPSGASRAVCFVDNVNRYAYQERGWELIQHKAPNPRREAWKLRCEAHRLFPDARKTVWIDASFTLMDLSRLLLDASGHPVSGLKHHKRNTCYQEGLEIIKVGQADSSDVAKQMNEYARQDFQPSALTISCILVRENSSVVNAFNECWEKEIYQHPGDNTQISLDYAAWKAGLSIHHLTGVRHNNPYAVHDATDHKRRRQRYDTDTTLCRSSR
jgi:hypothetical protein